MRMGTWLGLAAALVFSGCPSDEGDGGNASEGEGASGQSGGGGEGGSGTSSGGTSSGGTSSGGTSTGTGGAGEPGGTSGTSGGESGTSGGTTGSHPCYPDCFYEVVKDCVPEGPCTFAFVEGQYAECYENGVGFCGMSAPPPAPAHGVVTKTDGTSVCVTMDIRYEGDRSIATLANADGQEVTTSSAVDGSSTIVEVTCGGETFEIDVSNPECLFGSGGMPGICERVDTPACTCE